IPTNISDTCTTFFNTLNSDASIKSCTTPLLSATQYYTGSNATSSTEAKTALQDSLSELCASDAGCDTDLVRQYLSSFWTSCMTEIQNENKEVQDVYDVLYLLVPFREAICSEDDSGNYCLLETANSTTSSTTSKRDLPALKLGLPGNVLKRMRDHASMLPNAKRHEAAETAEVAEPLEARQSSDNATDAASTVDSLNGTNIAFLFLQPDSDKSVLCGTCAQSILASYIKFETALPYAIGLSNSHIFSGQSALYKAGQATCGDTWATKVNEIAGTTDFAKVAGAA
ncbi:hypothetical protein BCV69DRAFT_238709, partial [Microstroma glucosiphilum]